MTRLLLRAAKDPWTPIPSEIVLAQNTIANNVGNLIFGQAVHRTLSVPGAELIPNGYLASRAGLNDNYIQRVNDEFDGFVIPLANAFRTAFLPNLQRLTRMVQQLRIPVTVIGVGSQHKLTERRNSRDRVADGVKDFMSAVLDHSASVGVRGELTAAYLKELGFGDAHVDIIGCPSIFLNGPSPVVTKKVAALDEQSAIALNLSPYVRAMGVIATRHAFKYPELIYIPQVHADLNTMVWGENPAHISDLQMPVHTHHPLYLQDRMRFPLDPRTWVEYLTGFDFAFGTRVHGNIAALLAGTPAVLLVHDSRTLELAEYHDIPYRVISQLKPDHVDAADLYQHADYSAFNAGLEEKLRRLTMFLEKNGLSHIYQPGKEGKKFDRLVADADLPSMVPTLMATGDPGRREIMDRLRWLRQGLDADKTRSRYQYVPAFSHGPKPVLSMATLDKSVRVLGKQFDRADARIDVLERSEARRPAVRIRRWLVQVGRTRRAQRVVDGVRSLARRSGVG